MNKEDLTKQVNIGINAERLLRDELLASIFFSKKNQACQAFMETSHNDDTARRHLWSSVQGVISLEQELQQLIESGNIAREQLLVIEEAEAETDNSVHNCFGNN